MTDSDRSSSTSPLLLALKDIKLAHSVFALPFALVAAALAFPATDTPADIALKTLLIVLCMVFARTWAMLFNRIADADIDADNPRTAGRAVASGALQKKRAWAFAGGAAFLFFATTVWFRILFENSWPAYLALPTLGFIALYSLTKRFTLLCHVFLGAALAVSPLAAAVAVDPGAFADGRANACYWLAGFVLLWVAGFDVIYALQDLEYDRSKGLHSIPSKLGWRGAVWVSRLLHGGAVAMLVVAARADQRFGLIFAVGAAAVVGLLVVEHAVLVRRGPAGIPVVFFTYNGVVSVVLGAAGIADVLI